MRVEAVHFDEMWLFAVDTGTGLRPEECTAIGEFRRSGRGLLVTRDHMDLGNSLCNLEGVGAAHQFHTMLVDKYSPTGAVRFLPSHPHEGAVRVPENEAARIIAVGHSKVTGRRFNLAVAFEASHGKGRAIAASSFHHFVDYNWDPRVGSPSFVDEPAGDGILREPVARGSVHIYVRNVAA